MNELIVKLVNVQNFQIKNMVNDQIRKLRKYHGKICVDLLCPYVMRRKGQKENLNLKDVTMIDPIT